MECGITTVVFESLNVEVKYSKIFVSDFRDVYGYIISKVYQGYNDTKILLENPINYNKKLLYN